MTATIGYLAQVFPHLTMTFVYREVLALRAAGLAIDAFATWRPKASELSAEAKPLVAETFYIFPLRWTRFVRAHLRFGVTRPLRYLRTLAFCLTRPQRSWRNRLRTLLHFGQGVYLADEVARRGITHLHVHFALNAATLALIVQRLTGIPFSFTAHANDIFANPILLPEKLAAARFVVAISDYNAAFLRQVVPEAATKIHVVHCGIDVADFTPLPYRPQSVKPTIVAVGRLVEKKGYPYLIEACRLLRERGDEFTCRIAGDGPQQAQLQALIAAYGLEPYVYLDGQIFEERLKSYLAQADLITLPCVVAHDQDMDGIPNSLMEGMAMGLPAVSTTLSGIPELIEHEQSGLLVPPNDAVALADALARLIEEPALRRRLGQAGRAKVTAEYALAKNTAQLVELLRRYGVVTGPLPVQGQRMAERIPAFPGRAGWWTLG